MSHLGLFIQFLNFVDEFLAVISIIYHQVVLLSSLFFSKCFEVAVSAVAVDMSRCGQVIHNVPHHGFFKLRR
jgi:hypothetical protein